jgi:hypothetical protein
VDNSAAGRWAPPWPLVILGWLAALGALYWCVLGATEPAGRLFAAVTTAVLAAAALYGTRARPRLAVDRHGVRVAGPLHTHHHPWRVVHRVCLVYTRRLGREVPTLEVEVGDRLYVFGRLDLGEDPRDVAVTVLDLRADADLADGTQDRPRQESPVEEWPPEDRPPQT